MLKIIHICYKNEALPKDVFILFPSYSHSIYIQVDKIMEKPNIHIFCLPPVLYIEKQGIIIIFLGKIQPWKLEPKTHNL